MSRELFVNADFDLSLCPGRRGGSPLALRLTREMGLHAVFGVAARDSVLLHVQPPDDFLQYLRDNGIEPPRLSVLPAIRDSARFEPHGWNAEAADLNRRYRRPSPHPDLEVVRRVNGRELGAGLSAEIDGQELDLGSLSEMAELEARLGRAPDGGHGWVVKAEHANAALGNRRLHCRRLDAAARRWVEARLAEGQRLHLEVWQERIADLSVTFEIGGDACLSEPSLHEVVNTADGAFIGAVFEPEPALARSCGEAMAGAAEVVGRRLAGAGYFGPVCLDAYLWRSPAGPRLRAVVDVNARRHASHAARELWQRLGGTGTFYWRLFARRRLGRLPGRLDRVAAALGDDAWQPGAGRGVLVTSPLWCSEAGVKRPLHRVGVLFAGSSRAEVTAMEQRFRDRLEG